MKVCIRVDGGKTIGMGHVIRMIVLAEKLRKNSIKVFFVCKTSKLLYDKYKAGIAKIKKNGFEVVLLDEDHMYEEIKKIEADVIITDSYDVDEEYFNILKTCFDISGCIYDTDTNNMHFNVDFFINPDIYARELKYDLNSNTETLLGTDYVILRKNFLKHKPKSVKRIPKDIIITLGGSDCCDIMEKVLKSVTILNQYTFHVIVGAAFKYKERLLKYESYRMKFYYNIDNIEDIMMKCDIAISACGTTLYELMYCGIPTLGMVIAENQVVQAKAMEKVGAVKITNIENITTDILNLTFEERVKMRSIGNSLVDGMGSKKIIDRIIEICSDKNM
ncbi:UDP-2,4-diacetamido-2,4,6-trideoxy-beta-L-altropyranose hydrolase [Clostridium sp. ZBS12]|uniref:UDP-2,4-diacetamido-2,4, 6-trideoxy-beta-L-altropyranose hydrolase n=1 Tax=Clostridium sp. ZBS12 TaxID=2949972 RepID=UPI00207A93A9|nr:UDP-2,4-diacetamido-2,4,6-trideoxy-beta-L-altropyranose hydrolase [Clostridium sp. ZBS12]